MAKKDLSYKYDKCNCGKKKLKVSANCQRCRAAIQASLPGYSVSKPVVSSDGCCLVCKTKLKPKQKAFCSLECRHAHARLKVKECLHCGQQFKPKESRIKYCTNECANRHKSELYRKPESKMQQSKTTVNGCKLGASCRLSYSPCIECGGKRSTLKKQKFCSSNCMNHHYYLLQCNRGSIKRFTGLTVCRWCGSKRFNRVHANKMFCSGKCSSKHHKAQRNHRKRSLISERGINWKSAVATFGWSCACCKTKCVRPQGFNLPNEATLDHIHPIARGGTHTWDNVQVLCRKCNTLKNDSVSFMFDLAGLPE